MLVCRNGTCSSESQKLRIIQKQCAESGENQALSLNLTADLRISRASYLLWKLSVRPQQYHNDFTARMGLNYGPIACPSSIAHTLLCTRQRQEGTD